MSEIEATTEDDTTATMSDLMALTELDLDSDIDTDDNKDYAMENDLVRHQRSYYVEAKVRIARLENMGKRQ